MFVHLKLRSLLYRACGIIFALVAGVTAAQSAPTEMTSRLIVKLRDSGTLQTQAATSARMARVSADAAAVGVALTYHRAMAIGAHVMALDRPLTVVEATAVAARLARNPDVEFAQPDVRRRANRTTNDPYISSQPYLGNMAGGIDAFTAWDVTTGSPSVVVAVVDTGYRPHADLAGRILPGYDFISDPKVANDGDARDADASDPGDWVSANDLTDPDFKDCSVEDSSWHGTSVIGIIAANSNNGKWLAGIDWAAQILPVRALGKCGGWDSDIVDGVAWAAGLSVPNVPANPYPAHVINLSLGGSGVCPAAYHSVFSAALAHGVTRAIIAAAGNDGTDVANSVPSNCSETIAVAATLNGGALAPYSDFGTGIALSAPGGNADDVLNSGISVLYNFGKTTPEADAWAGGAGTSFSAPMVSGVASLVLGLAPNLSAAQLRSLLTSTASAFAPGVNCDQSRCGAGIVNAHSAVVAALGNAPAANYQGLWWYSPGAAEDGWGINFAHQGDTIFGTWFTYEANATGKGWWLTLIATKSAPGVYTGNLYATTGPPFSADPFIKAPGSPPSTGTAILSFSDANNGSFHYTLNLPGGMVDQTKPITRQPLGSAPMATCSYGTQPNLAAATNYQDIWWAGTSANPGTEQGWGINFAHQGDIVFASWFTYDLDTTPLWLVATAQKTGPGTYAGILYRPTGPRLDAYNKAQFSPNPPVGSMTLTFSDGNNANFHYDITGVGTAAVSQTKQITRELFSPSGTVCH